MTKKVAVKGLPLLKGEANLKKAIGSFKTASAKFHAGMNCIVMSALGHAAEHRNPAILNEVFDVLNKPYQHALKLYVKGKCDDFLGMEKSKFVVIKGTVEASNLFASEIEKHYSDKPFYEYKTEGQADPFSNDDVMKRLNAMIKQATKEGSLVSKDVVGAMEELKSQLVKFGVNTIQ